MGDDHQRQLRLRNMTLKVHTKDVKTNENAKDAEVTVGLLANEMPPLAHAQLTDFPYAREMLSVMLKVS